MEIDDDFPAAVPADKPTTTTTTHGAKEFDLESYIASYSGHTKVDRLVFIAEHCKELELDAYKVALDELKKTTNTAVYKQVADKVGDRLGPGYRTDQAWIDGVDKRAAQQLEKLEQDLGGYKANLVKESIRVGHNDLGDFYYNRGDLSNAMKCYVRTRDYCTTSKHIIHLCINVIRVSLEMNNYSHVTTYVSKAEQTPDIGDPTIQPKLKTCSGLANLENKKYKVAAQKFLETNFNLTDFSDVISPQDVAIYGGLCALATFDRTELKKKVIDNQGFRNFLELVPQVREMINDFYSSRYKSCLSHLEKLKPDLELDLHLHDHIEPLYTRIRNKALIQYFSPFISVDLNAMAAAFNTTVNGLEKELARLIMEGSISARIDSHNKRLYARKTDQRSATFQNALRVGEEYQRNASSLILRVNLMRNDFVIKPPRREESDK